MTELNRFLRNLELNGAPPAAPRVMLYIPGGRPIHCPDLDSAKSAAEDLAAERPGRTVAVYQLVGYAHKPIEKPQFQDSEQAIADLAAAPPEYQSDVPIEGFSDIARSDLTPEQQATLQRVREAMHDEGEATE